MKKIKKLLAAVLVFALCAAFFAACAKNDEPTTASTASEPTTETYESVKMNIGCISGPTGIGMAYLMGQSDEKKTANEYTFSVATSPDEIVSRFANGEMTKDVFSSGRRFRLWMVAHCPWVYYFSKQV